MKAIKPLFRFLLLIVACSIVCLIITSCDPAKKMQRICKKHPDICKQDTITTIIRDSITTPHIVIDTTFIQSETHSDTVYLVKDNLVIKYKYNTLTKQVYISGEVKPQKYIFERKIQVVSTDVTFRKHWSDYLALAITVITGLIFITGWFRKK